MSRAVRLGVAAVLALAALTIGTTAATAQSRLPTYRVASAPVGDRVSDLVKRMTLEEKVGQMATFNITGIQGDCEWSGGALNETCMQQTFVDSKIGNMLSGGGATPPTNTPQAWAEMVNAVQKYALDHSRLHIPITYGVDAVHGHNNVLGATKFQQQIGLGATWDAQLTGLIGESTGKVVKATGPQWNYSPVLEVSRDTRWGRYYETYSEDPYLASALGSPYIQGVQKSGQVTATDKHFAGYSEPFNGHDRVPADVSQRYLQDTLLPPYKAGVDSGAMTVMANSGAVNGVPATASHYLLTDVLRDQWGFKGVVVSDWDDVLSLQTRYHLADNYADAAALAVNAGVDMAMLPPTDNGQFPAALLQAAKAHKVSGKRIDQAVSRILTLKFRLGLFDHPYVDASKADATVLGADKDLAVRAATESQVLLKNDGNVLPLSTGIGKVVVAGPSADSVANQDGGWTIGWQGIPDGSTEPGVTVYEGVRDLLGAGKVDLATNTADAVSKTNGADAAIVAVGEKPGAEGLNDSENPALAADQQDLIDALQATGKPVIVVVIASRPLVLGRAADAKQLIAAWLPGSEAGTAVANVIFGKANPSGRLPVSWPKTAGDEPMYYQQLNGTNGGDSSGYDPQFPFGAGLSYTTYAVQSVSGPASVSRNGSVKVNVTVANTGSRDGDMVVPVYAQQPVSPILVPPNRLVAFTRVSLKAGETKTVSLSFPMSRLAVTKGDVNGSGTQVVLPGAYKIVAGDKSADLTVR
ncbi:MAG TPA: glycoside hydrolase family 3 N-terminal domain-containing protein [Streptosporangiaceae bacterium]|jgi:beta-glucosidase